MPVRGPAALRKHQTACRACHVCVDAGIIPEANPTFSGEWGAPFYLVGQAPGPAERESRRPFSGRAGKELDRWMLRAGFSSSEEFRRVTYIAALMAIARFLGPGSLEERVGRKFGDEPVMVPLPHPSGQSRWLNAPANRERLEQALALIAKLRRSEEHTSELQSHH